MTAGSRHRRHFTLRPPRSPAGSRRRLRRCRRASRVTSVSLRMTSTDSGTTLEVRAGACSTVIGRREFELATRVAEQRPSSGLQRYRRDPAIGPTAPAGSWRDDEDVARLRALVRNSTSGSLCAMRRIERSAAGEDRGRSASAREPFKPRRMPVHVARRSRTVSTSDAPDLEDGLALAACGAGRTSTRRRPR